MIGGTPMGGLPGDPQWQRYYLKDLCFESVLPRQTQGWEVSECYVSLSQIGFTPWHPDKKAVFSGSLKADQFRIRTADGDAVSLSGSLATLTNALGVFKVADFSGLQEKGRYYVEAGNTRSVIFPITIEPFKPAIEKYLHFYACMRSGTATPAHPKCFMDDAIREDTREAIDMVGGWFDASDLRLYVSSRNHQQLLRDA